MLRSLGLFAASTLIAALAIFTSAKDASASGAVTFFAVLNGQSECTGNPPTCHQGDLNGFGAATILLVPGAAPKVCFGIVTDNLTQNITVAHIHTGGTGTTGGIIITLSPTGPAAPGDPRGWGGCASAPEVTTPKINAIKNNPQNYYVNVHTGGAGGFPAGAIRGQLF